MQTRPSPEHPSQFYQLILQEDLLGGWTVVRQWGRTGQRGTMRRHYYDDRAAAEAALERWRREKTEQGFDVTFVEGDGRHRR